MTPCMQRRSNVSVSVARTPTPHAQAHAHGPYGPPDTCRHMDTPAQRGASAPRGPLGTPRIGWSEAAIGPRCLGWSRQGFWAHCWALHTCCPSHASATKAGHVLGCGAGQALSPGIPRRRMPRYPDMWTPFSSRLAAVPEVPTAAVSRLDLLGRGICPSRSWTGARSLDLFAVVAVCAIAFGSPAQPARCPRGPSADRCDPGETCAASGPAPGSFPGVDRCRQVAPGVWHVSSGPQKTNSLQRSWATSRRRGPCVLRRSAFSKHSGMQYARRECTRSVAVLLKRTVTSDE